MVTRNQRRRRSYWRVGVPIFVCVCLSISVSVCLSICVCVHARMLRCMYSGQRTACGSLTMLGLGIELRSLDLRAGAFTLRAISLIQLSLPVFGSYF